MPCLLPVGDRDRAAGHDCVGAEAGAGCWTLVHTLDTGAAPQAGQLYSQQQWTEWTLSSTVVTLSQIRPLSSVSDNIGQRISATQTISCDTVCSEEDGLHSYID